MGGREGRYAAWVSGVGLGGGVGWRVCVCVGQVASGTRTVAVIAPGPVPHMHPVTRRLRLP